MRLQIQVSNLRITASNEINSSCIIKKSKPVTIPWETKQLQRLLFKNNNSFLMKAIVVESKFRAMTNSFLPLGDGMLIKTDDGPVNSLMALFLWSGSTDLSCFPFKTKKIWYTQRALKGVKRALMGKGQSSRTSKVSKSSTASPDKSPEEDPQVPPLHPKGRLVSGSSRQHSPENSTNVSDLHWKGGFRKVIQDRRGPEDRAWMMD